MSRWIRQLALLLVLPAVVPVAHAGGVCPPPPNPSGCPLDEPRSYLQEADVDVDGSPDNFGSTGNFCGGGSPASCGSLGAEVAFQLFVADPANQTVTCEIPGGLSIEVWIMSTACNNCLATGTGSATLPAGTSTATLYDVVVSDVNGEVCPCGGLLTCTFDREAVCDDGVDGDGDGLIDGADPDCCPDNDGDGYCGAADCDDNNSVAHELPQFTEGLTLNRLGPGETVFTWDSDQLVWTDIVSGRLDDLKSSGDFSQSQCLKNDETTTSYTDERLDPASGHVEYFVARRQNTCGLGLYSVPSLARFDLDFMGPCPLSSTCSSCTFCNPIEPELVCEPDEYCYPTQGIPPSQCLGPAGTGTDGSACADTSDCAAGFYCDPPAATCEPWCRIGVPGDCPIGTCAPGNPPIIISGVEYGICF